MKKALLLILVFIFIASMVVIGGGCKPEAAKETTAAEGAAAGESPFKGIKVVHFVGGDPGDPFGSVVQKGANEAEKVLGCDVTVIYSGWLMDKLVQQLREIIAQKPDGICFMGHPGEDAVKELIDKAVAEGIIVTTQNVNLPNLENAYKGQGFGYVGQNLYDAGYLLGQLAVERSGAKEGDRAFVWGVKRMPVRGDRSKGMEDAPRDAGLIVDYLEVGDDIMGDPNLAKPVLAGYLAQNPDVKILLPDTVEVQQTIISFIRDSKEYTPDSFFVANFDINIAVVEAIREGIVDVVLDQQPYLQGFLPVLQVCLTKKYGFGGLSIDTGAGIIDKSNVEFVAKLAEDGYR